MDSFRFCPGRHGNYCGNVTVQTPLPFLPHFPRKLLIVRPKGLESEEGSERLRGNRFVAPINDLLATGLSLRLYSRKIEPSESPDVCKLEERHNRMDLPTFFAYGAVTF